MNAVRAVVLSTRGHADLAARVAGLLGHRAVGQFPGAVPHTPVEVTEQALEFVRGLRADAVVSVGGGSTTGLGKAVASRLSIQHLVVPTTYAGSELTPMLGETSGGEKTTRSGPEILPDTVIYDVQLTTTLPWSVTVTSAVNAMAHAVEALYSKDADDESDQWATQAIGSLVAGLHGLRGDLDSLDARIGVALRRLSGRPVSRRGQHGAAPQALPHSRRHLQPAACRDPHRCSPVRHGLQRAGRARGDEPNRRGHAAAITRRPRCSPWSGSWAVRRRSGRSVSSKPTSGARPIWPSLAPTPTLAK